MESGRMFLLLAGFDAETRDRIMAAAGPAGRNGSLRAEPDAKAALESVETAASAGEPLPAAVLLSAEPDSEATLEAVRRLKADPRTRPVPVVVVAQGLPRARLEELYRAGANSCLAPPGEPARRAEALETLAGYWLRLNEPPPAATAATRARGA